MKATLLIAAVLAVSTAPALAALPSDGERMAATCAGCHGTRGASPGTHIPVIGGQSSDYVKKSMKGYKDGTRAGGVMVNLSKGYSDQQIDQISAAVASWKWQNSLIDRKKGKGKISASGTEACAGCHGAKGQGTPIGPHISGQPAGYLKEALDEYRSGRRTAAEMGMVKEMTDQDFDKLVKFYSQQK